MGVGHGRRVDVVVWAVPVAYGLKQVCWSTVCLKGNLDRENTFSLKKEKFNIQRNPGLSIPHVTKFLLHRTIWKVLTFF
jgi:hypothetical protein